jgi:AmiR/NasT family two-component response regulator
MLECTGEPFDLAYSQTAQRPVVLIVEDEFLIRMDAIDMIGAGGFEVVEAKNADEAIEILERRLDITVVFTDVTCRVRWMASNWPPLSGAGGRPSGSLRHPERRT